MSPEKGGSRAFRTPGIQAKGTTLKIRCPCPDLTSKTEKCLWFSTPDIRYVLVRNDMTTED